VQLQERQLQGNGASQSWNGLVMVSPHICRDDARFCWQELDIASRLLG
jgi:hypothetical protein